ncbi:RdRP-domain-containing protein [Violaceomyces palustris]|uniref:RdRP-domain-containing protein n=1 Tax=Violaceomyces palustris TaxID=1673888 RepID=A0ACD0P281_9BASI|nr:RdRP-domain-containing protein [Violaceomyces palustris]
MEVYVDKIPSWADQDEVEKALADAIHNEPVRRKGQGITNFAFIMPKSSSGKHRGYGFLTLPEFTTANRFLEKCAVGKKLHPVTLRGSVTLDFKMNGYGKVDLIERLLNQAYKSPEQRKELARKKERAAQKKQESQRRAREAEAESMRRTLEEREERRKQDEKARRLREKEDEEAHLEVKRWLEKQKEEEEKSKALMEEALCVNEAEPLIPKTSEVIGIAIKMGQLHLSKERRLGRLEKPGVWRSIQFGHVCEDGVFSIEDEEVLTKAMPAEFDEASQTMVFGDDHYSVKILYNSVLRWSVQETAVLFELERPATFVCDGKVASHWNFRKLPLDDPTVEERKKFRAALIGSTFRVTFDAHAKLDDFLLQGRRLLVRAGLPQKPRQCAKRNLFAKSFFEKCDATCQRLGIPLAFQFERLIRNGLLVPTHVPLLESMVSRSILERGEELTARLVLALSQRVKRFQMLKETGDLGQGPFDLKEIWCSEAKRMDKHEPVADLIPTGIGATFEVYHATVTPTRTLLSGPVVDTSNRVLRLFPYHSHHFIRVAFTDEDFDRFPVNRRDLRGTDSEEFARERIGGTLKEGIAIAGRRWDMLAWSSSSIGTHQCWFCTPFRDEEGKLWNAHLIRQALGDFSRVEMIPARYGARLSQAFSATAPTLQVSKEWIQEIDDIRSRSGHLFTDGVGQISPALMEKVWQKYVEVRLLTNGRGRGIRSGRVPSAIQIRIGGAKGVLCVNPTLEGMAIKLRPSMIKFDAPNHMDVEVATSSLVPLPTRLNRPLINALEDLGVDQERFVALQRLAVSDVEAARNSFMAASDLCRRYGYGTAFEAVQLFDRLHKLLDLRPDKLSTSGVMYRLISNAIAAALGDLKRKARIPTLGPTLIGVADEFDFLEKDEIFAQVEENEGSLRIVRGRVLIGRSPTIHPGDTRMINAVVPPEGHPLRQLRNVIVFSCKGDGRSLPSMLGGGDLDGDIYSLYEEPLLFPKRNHPPGQYKQLPSKTLNRPCMIEDLADFFTDFVINDQLGIVSHLHLQISDWSVRHSFDPACRKLAELHSQAVDYRKTGQAVRKKDLPNPSWRGRPDYLVQNDRAPDIYMSRRALGYLYREIAWKDTDMPLGPKQLHVPPEAAEADQDGQQHDFQMILSVIENKFPYIRPTKEELGPLQDRYRPLLVSFVYHLSRIAAWVPESRSNGEWLSEVEIILGALTTVTTSKTKRWQDKLQAATSELAPILKHELRAISAGGAPVVIQPTGAKHLDSQLRHQNFTSVDASSAAKQSVPEGAPKVRRHETNDLVAVSELDGHKPDWVKDRQDGEAAEEIAEKQKEQDDDGAFDPVVEDRALKGEAQSLYAATMLGATEHTSKSFGGDTFALVSLGALLEVIEQKEKRWDLICRLDNASRDSDEEKEIGSA